MCVCVAICKYLKQHTQTLWVDQFLKIVQSTWFDSFGSYVLHVVCNVFSAPPPPHLMSAKPNGGVHDYSGAP